MLRSDFHSNRQCHLSRKLHLHEQLKKSLTGRSQGATEGIQIRKIVAGTVIGTLINSLVLLPGALAATVQLGVVRSPDNRPLAKVVAGVL